MKPPPRPERAMPLLTITGLRRSFGGAEVLSGIDAEVHPGEAHAQCPVMAVPPSALARELRHGRLARAFWRRSLTPDQVLRDQRRPAA